MSNTLQGGSNRTAYFASGKRRMRGMVVDATQIDFIADLNLRSVRCCEPDRIRLPADLMLFDQTTQLVTFLVRSHAAAPNIGTPA